MARSDKRLQERWIESQDAEAFRQIALRHSAMVHSTCQRILGDPSQAEDVTQECFQRLASHGIAVRSVAARLYRVATNLSLKQLRAEKRYCQELWMDFPSHAASTLTPSLNSTPAMTSGMCWYPNRRLHRFSAACVSLSTIARHASTEPAPFVL